MDRMELVARRKGTERRVWLFVEWDRSRGVEVVSLEGDLESFAIWESWVHIRHMSCGYPPGWEVLDASRG